MSLGSRWLHSRIVQGDCEPALSEVEWVNRRYLFVSESMVMLRA
jgi:hypothetical protein